MVGTALTERGAADRVVYGERPLGAPLVVELEAGPGLHPSLARAADDLLPAPRRVVAPQRVRGRLGAPVRPPETQEAPQHVARRVARALVDLPHVPGRVHAPDGVGPELLDAVLMALVRRRGGLGWSLAPAVLQHETLRRAWNVHRDVAAAPDLFALLRFRLAASEHERNEQRGEASLGPAHLSPPKN